MQYLSFLDARLNDTKFLATSFNLWQKVSGTFVVFKPPFFYFFQDKATFWGALLGNDWGLSRLCSTMACILCLIYVCFTMMSLIFCVINLPVIIFSCTSPLIAVVPRWSCHLFLGRLREWDSLCCWFGTGDWHLTCLSDLRRWTFLTFHHSSRAL